MREHKGASELLGALILLMVTLATFGVVTVAFYQQSSTSTSNLIQQYRNGQIASGELLTLVYHSESCYPGKICVWVYNYGSFPVTVSTVYVGGSPVVSSNVQVLCYSGPSPQACPTSLVSGTPLPSIGVKQLAEIIVTVSGVSTPYDFFMYTGENVAYDWSL